MIRRSITTYGGQTIVRYKLAFGIGAASRRGTHGWQLAVHVVHAPGSGAWHNHYWDSWSLCLLGGIAEATDGGTRQIRPGTLRFRPHNQRHRVRGYAVTLILTSPRRHRSSIWLRGLAARPIRARSRVGYSRRVLARFRERRSAMKIPLTIAACVFLLAACGGGGGSTSPTSTGPDTTGAPNVPMLSWHQTDGGSYSVAGLPAPTPAAARHMPVYHDGRRLFVGVDQGAGKPAALPIVGRRGETEIRLGELTDGGGRGTLATYLLSTVDDPGLRWKSPPEVRFGGAGDQSDYERVVRAVQLVNAALPEGQKMRVPSMTPSDDPGTGIYFSFDWLTGLGYWGETHNSNASATSQITHSLITITRDYTSNGDRQATILLAHELLHALGMFGGATSHVPPTIDSILAADSRIYASAQGTRQPLSLLYSADREAIRALYSRLSDGVDPTSFGLWEDTSWHLVGRTSHVAFGVALRNDYVEPWAYGDLPATDLAANRGLSGRVTWTGVLLGFGPDQTVSGDAAIAVDLATLRGSADFTNLEMWN
ncbi:MAG: hypothetical protein F4Z93_08905, partial [Rhodospirillales bacterium]|nr:hypothetical protein [Rhodospirillales bacterium]